MKDECLRCEVDDLLRSATSCASIPMKRGRVAARREIVSFDLCEVAPAADGGEWDANVGARVLYKLAGAALRSREPGWSGDLG